MRSWTKRPFSSATKGPSTLSKVAPERLMLLTMVSTMFAVVLITFSASSMRPAGVTRNEIGACGGVRVLPDEDVMVHDDSGIR